MRGYWTTRIGAGLLSASLALTVWTLAAGAPPPAAPDIKALPGKAATLLGIRCLSCHNAEKKAGGIDLTTRANALQTNAFVPNNPDQSRMVRAVTSGKMPPDGRLPDAEIALVRQWVTAGGTYSHEPLTVIKPPVKPLWSFQPIAHPTVPHSRYDPLAKNPVDKFIFAELEKHGLKPSAPASRRALLRRVTLDLTGLPPTPTEIQNFLNDNTPNAYEKVVDRLLASPAYGERWGRHWLDVVRYGESHGYEQNHLRPNAWPYRDYVIKAFNQDKPFDTFITEQLAGDIVGRGNPDVEVATGFLVAGIHDTVGIQEEQGTRQQRSNDMDDFVSTTGATFLGLTVNCAKCHDHKFDPIPARDYYRLAAVFADVRHGDRELSLRVLTPEQQARATQLQDSIGNLSDEIAALEASAQARLQNLPETMRPPVNTRRNVENFAPVPARFLRFTILATNDGGEPCLDEVQIFGPGSSVNLALASGGAKASASSLIPGYPIHTIAHLNDGILGNMHSWVGGERNGGWVQIELPRVATVSRIVWSREVNAQYSDRLATVYRMEVSEDGSHWTQVATGENRLKSASNLSPDAVMNAMTSAQNTRYSALQTRLAALRQQAAANIPVMVAYCGQFTNPDPTYLLKGGDVMRREEQVTPGALSLLTALPSDLSPPPSQKADAAKPEGIRLVGNRPNGAGKENEAEIKPRLRLAQWITDPRNPLTARVLVNRVWGYHFGTGIVDTPSDFGNIGSAPSHPALLDYLATDVMAHGWKLTRLHRLLVTSYTYRQTSAVTETNRAGEAKDADNRLLWRMPLRRMEAEAVRDAILATSGKLDRTMGGPGFRLFTYEVINVAIYGPLEEQGPETWRRSVYQIPARGIRDDLLGNFDCPDSSERTPHRSNTTTALQALGMFNSKFLSEQADFFAARVQSEAGAKPEAQIRRAFVLAMGRTPTDAEAAKSQRLTAQYGLPTLCRALLNTSEFLYY